MKKLPLFILYLLLFGLAAEVVVLGLQKRKQQEILTRLLAGQEQAPVAASLAAGDRLEALPPLTLSDESRHSLPFGKDQPPRLLLVFNTRCPACSTTVPVWNRLARSAAGSQIPVVAMTSDPAAEVAEYARRNDPGYPAYSLGDADYKALLRVGFVPHTILVAGDATVLGVWPGPLDPTQEARIENLLGAITGSALSATAAWTTPVAPVLSEGPPGTYPCEESQECE